MSSLAIIRGAPFHPALLAVYPVLHVAAANPGQAPRGSVIGVVLVALSAALVMLAVARPLFRAWPRAGLGAAVLVVIGFAFGPIHAHFENQLLDALEGGGQPALAPDRLGLVLSLAAVLAVGACSLLIVRLSQDAVARLTRALNVVSLVLVAFAAAQLLLMNGALASESGASPEHGAGANAPQDTRDIYYIVLDGYARQDILEQYYGFDNHEFVTGLQARRFTVSGASTSNYYWTFLSLASALNFRYVAELVNEPLDERGTDRSHLYQAIRNNAVAGFLRERGYEIVHVQSTWGATRDNPHADLQVRCSGDLFGDEFRRAMWDATWLRVFSARASEDLASCHNSGFESLKSVARRPAPKFVFAHFVLPHHPYLFDRNGRVLREADLSSQFEIQKRLWEDRRSYLEQLLYVNRRVLDVVDAIAAGSARPPIIVIQSDHGPNLRRAILMPEQMRIRFANFSAHRLPDAPADLIPDDDTPVNLFRRLLNHYFGTRHPILPNQRFYSTYRRPFGLREIDARELAADASPPAGEPEGGLDAAARSHVN